MAHRLTSQILGLLSGVKDFWLISIALAIILVLHTFGGVYWIQQNIARPDRMAERNLQVSFQYAQFLSQDIPSLAFYKAFTYDVAQPPAIFILVQPFLRTLGLSADSAQLLNISLFLSTVALTFWVGIQVTTPKTGLFATLLVGLLPVMTGMSRLFHIEMLLTVLVLFNLLSLYKSHGFQHRGWTLCIGISLGAGMLTHLSAIVFAVPPLIWFWRTSHHQHAQQCPSQNINSYWHTLLYASLMASSISWLIYWPNRTYIQTQMSGDWLLLAWTLLGSIYFFYLWSPSTPRNNFLSTISLAILIASLHYLPLVQPMLELVPFQRLFDLQTLVVGVTQILLGFPEYQLGRLAFWLILPLATVSWVYVLIQKRLSVYIGSIPLWLSLLTSLLIIPIGGQVDERGLAPILPILAILLAVGLSQYPPPVKLIVGTVWVIVLVIQWSIFTFNLPFHSFGREDLWVSSKYVFRANAWPADDRYWVAPKIIHQIAKNNTPETQSIGVLVNKPQIYANAIKNEVLFQHLNATIYDIATNNANVWLESMSSQWLITKDGDTQSTSMSGQEIASSLLQNRPPFSLLYREVQRYPLPNNEYVYLFHRSEGPGNPLAEPESIELARPIAEAIRANWSAGSILIYTDSNIAVWIGIHEVGDENTIILKDAITQPETVFSELSGSLFVVSGDQQTQLTDWLNANAYQSFTAGNNFASLNVYGKPSKALVPINSFTKWHDLDLVRIQTLTGIAPGEVLPIEFEWAGVLDQNRKISVRLIDHEDAVIASIDRWLTPYDRFGLLVPPTTKTEEFKLSVLLYDAQTLEPIPDLQQTSVVPIVPITVRE